MIRELFATLFVALFLGSCLADLRPKGDTQANKREASIELFRLAKAHGYQSWTRTRSFECEVQDSFIGWIGRKSSPFAEAVVVLDADYKRGKGNGQFQIVSGKDSSEIWHYNSRITYLTKSGENILQEVDDKNIRFWVPTYAYFIEFPFRILEADALMHLGTETIGNSVFTKVLASWKTTEPQKDIDQYVIYIGETGRIAWIDYTIREQFSFLKGRAVFKDYQQISGVFIPARIDVYSNLTGKKRMLHQMRLSEFKFSTN